MKFPWKTGEKSPTLEGEGTGTKEGEVEGEKKTESSSEPPPTDTGVQSPFSSDGPFAGKTEKEIADLLALQDVTIKAQNMEPTVTQPPVVAPEPEPVPVDPSSEEWFQNPGKSTRTVVKEVIQSELKEIVADLRQDMAAGRARTAWDDAASEIPNLSAKRPMIEAVLKQRGIENPTIETIIGAHDLAVGQAARLGTTIPGMETTSDPPPQTENNRVIPQHPVSTQPLVQTETKETFEPLSENEARLARENKMTHADYRRAQSMDIADVIAVEEEAS